MSTTFAELVSAPDEIMSTPVTSCLPEASARQVARTMVEKGDTAVLVTRESGEAIGIITENDIVHKVVAPGDVNIDSITAGQIMTILIAAFGALGGVAKVDRVIQSLGMIAARPK